MRHGRVEVAGYQALFQFLAFTNPLLFSIGGLIMSTVAKDGAYQTQSVRNHLLVVVSILGSYLLLLAVAGPSVMRLLYGSRSQYLRYAPLLRIFAAAWSLEVIAMLATSILGGLREPRALFLVQLSGAAMAVLIVLPWVYWKGLMAAGFGMLLVNAARALTGILLLLRRGSGVAAGPGREAGRVVSSVLLRSGGSTSWRRSMRNVDDTLLEERGRRTFVLLAGFLFR